MVMNASDMPRCLSLAICFVPVDLFPGCALAVEELALCFEPILRQFLTTSLKSNVWEPAFRCMIISIEPNTMSFRLSNSKCRIEWM